MQPNEVKTGAKFYTRITNRVDIPVVVIADTREGTKRYVIQRTDNGAILPQLRGAGQLHLTPGPWEPGNPNARKKGPGLARANGRRRVATMGDATQAELLERLSKLDAPTTRFLVELINSIGSTAVAPSNKVVRAAK